MMYMYNKFSDPITEIVDTSVTVKGDENEMSSFPDTVGNPSYDKFLVDTKLTDKQVKALKPDVWYDFPEGDK
jgi:hypothetical protein